MADTHTPARASRHWSEIILSWLAAVICPWLLSIGLHSIHASSSTAGLCSLALVVLWSTLADREASIFLAVYSALLFDYYFVEPLYTLGISGYQAWLSMIAYLLCCVVVNRVAEHARRQTRVANQRREDVERLYDLNQDLMLHGDSANLLDQIPRLIQRNFALEQVLLFSRQRNQLYPAATPSAEELLSMLHETPTQTELDLTRVDGFSLIPVSFGMSNLGTLAWRPDKLSREVAASISAQIAVLLTRAEAIDEFTRLEAARSADRLRAALIDSLTHELRTPLTSIRAAATTLTGTPWLDEETSRELAQVVDEESTRLDQLIGEAVEIAEIESAGLKVAPEHVNITAFLDETIAQSRAELGARSITITIEPPQTTGWFDPHILARALRHLLENAARYTPEAAAIRLQVCRTRASLEFLVADNGPGIAADDLPHIFDKFYRGKKHTTAAGGASQPGAIQRGTGMGLAITRALIAAHQGQITVSSAPAQGATFKLVIPLVEPRQDA